MEVVGYSKDITGIRWKEGRTVLVDLVTWSANKSSDGKVKKKQFSTEISFEVLIMEFFLFFSVEPFTDVCQM